MSKIALTVYDFSRSTVDVPHANNKLANSLQSFRKVASSVFGIHSLPTPATISVRDSTGTSYDIPLTFRDSLGTEYPIDNFVRDSSGTEYRIT